MEVLRGESFLVQETKTCCKDVQVRWEDVGGLDDVKERLKEAVEWPFKSSQALGRLGAQPPKGKPCCFQKTFCDVSSAVSAP